MAWAFWASPLSSAWCCSDEDRAGRRTRCDRKDANHSKTTQPVVMRMAWIYSRLLDFLSFFVNIHRSRHCCIFEFELQSLQSQHKPRTFIGYQFTVAKRVRSATRDAPLFEEHAISRSAERSLALHNQNSNTRPHTIASSATVNQRIQWCFLINPHLSLARFTSSAGSKHVMTSARKQNPANSFLEVQALTPRPSQDGFGHRPAGATAALANGSHLGTRHMPSG